MVEEYVRFVLDDAHLSAHCKELRHELIVIARQLPANALHCMRDVPGDVGTSITTDSEYRRVEVNDVAAANLKRVEQSLRSLEEYTKVVSANLAAGFEGMRYQVYTLERAISALESSLARLGSACLYVLIDARPTLDQFRQLANALIHSKVDVLQLRDKQLPDRELLERAMLLRQLTRGTQVTFIMNDRVDLALAAGADGVHLGQDELPVGTARRLMGPQALIGVSTHAIDQARQAVLDGANYIGCGPTFPSKTKAFEEFPGLQYLRQVTREIKLPAFAIGGIDRDNLQEVRRAGFSRIAVSGSVINASDPAEAASTLARLLRTA